MIRPLHLVCLIALLTPLVACAQDGVVDHDWRFHASCRQYGAVQVTYPGPQTYTYLCFGTAEYRVHAPILLPAAAILAPMALAALPLLRRRAGRDVPP